jgi:tetratricopeptide (TPR) repeat protein
MYLSGSHLQLRKTGRRSDPRRIILLLFLILGGVLLLGLNVRGVVQPIGEPTPAPTRSAISYAEEAEALFAAGRLDKAAEAYKEATTRDTRNVDYWVALARIQIYNRQYEPALNTAETARLVAPNNVKAKAIYAWAVFWNFGLTGCKCKTQEEALAAAREALALDRNYAPAHAYYSEILNDAGQFTEGASQAQQALALDPNSLDARRAMGMANEMVGNYQGAAERYKSALAINPNLITLYLRLGRMYQALAQRGEISYQQAIDAFTKANAINPDDVEPYLRLSEVYYQDDQLGVAEQYLDQALQREPSNPNIHGKLGLLLFRRKNYEGAEPELNLAIYGGQVEVSKEQGKVMVKGMPLDENSKEFYYTLGNLMAFNYDCAPDRAPAILGQVLAKFPDDKTVQGSYDESMKICANFLAGTTTPQPTPSATPKPNN